MPPAGLEGANVNTPSMRLEWRGVFDRAQRARLWIGDECQDIATYTVMLAMNEYMAIGVMVLVSSTAGVESRVGSTARWIRTNQTRSFMQFAPKNRMEFVCRNTYTIRRIARFVALP